MTTARLDRHGLPYSMSRQGNYHHNTVMESWFASVTSEEGEHFHSYAHARALLFEYLPRGVHGGEAG